MLGELPPPDAIDDAWDWDATEDVVAELRDRVDDTVQRSLEQGGFWRMLFERHIEVVLETTSLAGSVGEVLKQLWSRYYGIEPTVEVQPTVGAVFTTHVAAATLALHETLLDHGISREELYRLAYDIGWRFYTEMG